MPSPPIPAEPAIAGERPGFMALLAEPNLRRLWIFQLCSSAGESLAHIAMPLLIYSMMGSA